MFLISWLLSGLLGVLLLVICDMRNSKYDENYFNEDTKSSIGLIIMLGWIGFFIVIGFVIYYMLLEHKIIVKNNKKKNHYITKLLYKIANIGVKNKSE